MKVMIGKISFLLLFFFCWGNVWGAVIKLKYRSGAEMEEAKGKKERMIGVTSFLEQKQDVESKKKKMVIKLTNPKIYPSFLASFILPLKQGSYY